MKTQLNIRPNWSRIGLRIPIECHCEGRVIWRWYWGMFKAV